MKKIFVPIEQAHSSRLEALVESVSSDTKVEFLASSLQVSNPFTDGWRIWLPHEASVACSSLLCLKEAHKAKWLSNVRTYRGFLPPLTEFFVENFSIEGNLYFKYDLLASILDSQFPAALYPGLRAELGCEAKRLYSLSKNSESLANAFLYAIWASILSRKLLAPRKLRKKVSKALESISLPLNQERAVASVENISSLLSQADYENYKPAHRFVIPNPYHYLFKFFHNVYYASSQAEILPQFVRRLAETLEQVLPVTACKEGLSPEGLEIEPDEFSSHFALKKSGIFEPNPKIFLEESKPENHNFEIVLLLDASASAMKGERVWILEKGIASLFCQAARWLREVRLAVYAFHESLARLKDYDEGFEEMIIRLNALQAMEKSNLSYALSKSEEFFSTKDRLLLVCTDGYFTPSELNAMNHLTIPLALILPGAKKQRVEYLKHHLSRAGVTPLNLLEELPRVVRNWYGLFYDKY